MVATTRIYALRAYQKKYPLQLKKFAKANKRLNKSEAKKLNIFKKSIF